MSYDITLKDPVTHETCEVPAHLLTGGTYAAEYHEEDGTFTPKPITEAWLNITYNYSSYFREAMKFVEGTENGIYDLKDIINGPAIDPYKYLTAPIFNIPGITTNHKLVLIAIGLFDEKETYKSETLIDNNLLQACIEGIEEAAKYIINQKIDEFKHYLARNGEQNEFEITVYLNNEVINQIIVDSCYI